MMELIDFVEKNQRDRKEYRGNMIYCISLVAVILVYLFVSIFWIDTRIVSGSSMINTLSDGDILVLNKLKTPEWHDVIVFRSDRGKDYIKRIIGIPGDVVYSEDGRIVIERVIDGETVIIRDEETYAFHPECSYVLTTRKDIERTVVGENEYFVLGDNRQNSRDSREFGVISKDVIHGVVTQYWIDHKEITTKIFGFLNNFGLNKS